MNQFLSPAPLWQNNGIAFIRIITGFLMMYHGWEIFDAAKMNEYAGWDTWGNASQGKWMAYLGKGAELVGGLLLFLGLFTRIGALLIAGTMACIAFFIGHGKIWYEDQHPFLFILLAMVFFITGPGAFSFDNMFFKNRR